MPSTAPPGLFLHRAARVEALASALVGELVRHPPADPFAPAQVVVGSRGMERWVRHRLAMGPAGIAANVQFPFPAEALAQAFGVVAEASNWAPATLAWEVLACLPELTTDPASAEAFQPVRAWLERVPRRQLRVADRDDLALARELAEVLDRAALFRPDWVAAWERGEDPSGPPPWQRHLWQRLRGQVEGLPATLALAAAAPQPGEAIHVFAVSSMPPAWVHAWRRLGEVRSVHVYGLSPSPDYWGELRTARELRREANAEALEAQQHPLLTALGRLSRDVSDLWIDVDPLEVDVPGGFDPPPSTRGLHQLQADVLALRSAAELASARAERCLVPHDDTLQFHAAHGPTRQVEALRDAVLDLFNRHPHLEPRHVLVMTPDVATYAPLVSAVFGEGYASAHLEREGEREGGREGEADADHPAHAGGPAHADGAPRRRGWGPVGGPAIPVAIHDLGLRELNPVADAVLRVLSLGAERLTAPAAFDLLALRPVRARFKLADDELDFLRGAVQGAGARWGADADERARHGNPEQHDFTFAFAEDRLALGVVMADEAEAEGGVGEGSTWAGVAPVDDMEGQGTALGKFAEFMGRLAAARRALTAPLPVARWCELLNTLVSDFTEVSRAASFLVLEVRAGIAALAAEASAYEGRVSLAAVRAALEGRFELGRGGDRPQSGAVTLCALQPMRSVPFPVVCLLGMDDGAFPRSPVGRGFDATLARPRPGDRDPREEDRNLLLEAILSAREHLLIFYTGTDAHVGRPVAPAVPVGDLLDCVDATFSAPGRARDLLTWRHAVQPFVATGFAGAPSMPPRFDRRMAEAARALLGPRAPWRGVLAGGNPLPPVEPPATLELQELAQWTRQPLRNLARARLGLSLSRDEEPLPDKEALEPGNLGNWALGALLCRRWLAGHQDAAEAQAYLRARALLPPGAAGASVFEASWARVETAAQALPPGAAAQVQVSLRVDGVQLVGTVATRGGEVIDFGVEDTDKPRRLVSAWISVLALAATRGAPAQARIVGESKGSPVVRHLRAPANPLANLERLVLAWRQARNAPVPRVEKCSHAAALAILAPRWKALPPGEAPGPVAVGELRADERRSATVDAAQEWLNHRDYGEGTDATLAAGLGKEFPFVDDDGQLTPEFLEAALDLWFPILAAAREPA